MGVVDVSECVCWEEFVDVSEGLYHWLQFLDDVGDGLMVFEVVLYGYTKERCFCVLFECGCLDGELGRRWCWCVRVEYGVVGLGRVWNEVVVVEVSDEVV